jgi:predicted nucleic acid-binding protein
MSLVYWDSMLFIYQFDNHPELGPAVGRIIERMEARGDVLCTSTFAVAEVLAGPYRDRAWDVVSKYRALFHSPDILLLEFRLTTAEIFAELRGRLGVSSADAVHLACAAEARVDLFLTHDRRLTGKVVPGIHFVADLTSDIL